MNPVGIFMLGVVALMIAINISSIALDLFRYFFGEKATKYVLVKPLQPSYKKALETYFTYYNNLPTAQKKIFERRVQLFIDLKKFIPRGFDHIPDEIKAIIAASAIQLTFGLPQVYLKHFTKILIHKDDYYNRIFRRYHQGEVHWHGGLIILSWKNFARGYMDHADGRNLGLHEMAHALKLENEINNGESGFLDRKLLRKWRREAEKIMEDINSGQVEFFRKYGGTNRDEFFAVAIENFFERPEEFKKLFPIPYDLLAGLLKQDPLFMKKMDAAIK